MTTIDLDTLRLASGAHHSPEDGMCLLEAVAFIRRAEDSSVPFNDAPECVSPVLRAFGISWNDALPDDERQQLKRYIPLLPGTAGDAEVDERRAWMATDWLVRVHTPAWLRLAGLTAQAEQLEALPELGPDTTPPILPALKAVRNDAAAAWAAAWDAAWDAARAAARDAAWDAARAAAWAAARAAARDAAWAAARDAAWDAARAAARAAAGAAAGAAAWAAARAAARDAARDALQPTRDQLIESAHDLFGRMIRVDAEVSA